MELLSLQKTHLLCKICPTNILFLLYLVKFDLFADVYTRIQDDHELVFGGAPPALRESAAMCWLWFVLTKRHKCHWIERFGG
jgi:hypothetical protein